MNVVKIKKAFTEENINGVEILFDKDILASKHSSRQNN